MMCLPQRCGIAAAGPEHEPALLHPQETQNVSVSPSHNINKEKDFSSRLPLLPETLEGCCCVFSPGFQHTKLRLNRYQQQEQEESLRSVASHRSCSKAGSGARHVFAFPPVRGLCLSHAGDSIWASSPAPEAQLLWTLRASRSREIAGG